MLLKSQRHFLVFAVVLIYGSCTNKHEVDQDIPQTGRLYDYLIDAGFSMEDISECGDYFLLEDDWVISQEEVQRLANMQQPMYRVNPDAPSGVQERQRVSGTSVISMANVDNISVFVDPSMANVGGVDYRPWVNLALSRWSQSNSGSKVNFTFASSHASADITIIRNNAGGGLVGAPALPSCMVSGSGWPTNSSTLGKALFPASGNPGRFVAIKFDYAGSNDSRVALLMHEIGHALGFRHSNSGSESNAWCGVTLQNILLSGTPDNDNNTVMKTPLDDDNTDLSSNDELAVRLLYPPSYHTPTITSVTQYSPTLNRVTILPVSPFYYRVGLEVSRVSDGAIMSTTSWNAVNNLQYPIQRPTTPGLYRVRLYGVNYGGDFQSAWSSYFNFTI